MVYFYRRYVNNVWLWIDHVWDSEPNVVQWEGCAVKEADGRSSQVWIERLAGQLQRWGLTQPAILFLEMTQPLSFVASQGLLLCEPLVSYFGELPVADYAEVLSDRANVRSLIVRLEQGEQVRAVEE